MTERQEATSAEDTLHRHGDLDPSKWDEAAAVTGRPNDLAEGKVVNSTFAGRAKAGKREKAVSSGAAENKAVKGSESKGSRRKR